MRAEGPTPLSGVVIAFREEDRIAGCVRSLSFCDEVLVVDSGSDDRTREIAQDLGCRVLVNEPFPGHVQQKDWAVRHAEHDWVLCLDADERVSDALRERILAARSAGFAGAAYDMPRRNHYLGRVLRAGMFWPDRKLRLFDRRRARWAGTNPHDRVVVDSGEEPIHLDEPIEHLSYRDFRHHLRTADSYSRIAAEALASQGRRANPLDLLIRPPSAFVKSLVVKRGFLDGWRGLAVAAMGAYTDWLKYWRLLRLGRGSPR